MRSLLAALATLLVPSAARAALPPYYERARELTAILQEPRVQRQLRDQPIEGLELTAPDTWRVRAGNEVIVNVIDDAGPVEVDPRTGAPRAVIVGPRRFALRVGDARCGGARQP